MNYTKYHEKLLLLSNPRSSEKIIIDWFDSKIGDIILLHIKLIWSHIDFFFHTILESYDTPRLLNKVMGIQTVTVTIGVLLDRTVVRKIHVLQNWIAFSFSQLLTSSYLEATVMWIQKSTYSQPMAREGDKKASPKLPTILS